MEPFANLHRGVEKIEDIAESVSTFLLGMFAELSASTTDSTTLALIERSRASIDAHVKAIIANTPSASKADAPDDRAELAEAEVERKSQAGMPVPTNAVTERAPPYSEGKTGDTAGSALERQLTVSPSNAAVTAGGLQGVSNAAPPAQTSRTSTTSPVAPDANPKPVQK